MTAAALVRIPLIARRVIANCTTFGKVRNETCTLKLRAERLVQLRVFHAGAETRVR
jgi:hypothetical protein